MDSDDDNDMMDYKSAMKAPLCSGEPKSRVTMEEQPCLGERMEAKLTANNNHLHNTTN